MDNSAVTLGPSVCFKVQKIIGVSIGEGNLRNYQVQWAPSWVSGFHLVGCEKLIDEFVGGQENNRKCITDEGAGSISNQVAGVTQNPTTEVPLSLSCNLNNEEMHVEQDNVKNLISGNDPCTASMVHENAQGYCTTQPENPNFEWTSSRDNLFKNSMLIKDESTDFLGDYSEHVDKSNNSNEDHDEFSNAGLDNILKIDDGEIIIVEPSECQEYSNQNKKKLSHKCNRCQNAVFRTANELQRHCKKVHSGNKKVDNILGIVERKKNKTKRSMGKDSGLKETEHSSSDTHKDLGDIGTVGGSKDNGIESDCNNNTATTSSNINKEQDSFKLRMRSAFAEKSFKCAVCGKLFSNNSNLQVHMRLHTGQRSHQCSFCSKLFPSKTELRRHERVHTGERPFLCRVCHKTFKRNDHLKKHLQTHRIMI